MPSSKETFLSLIRLGIGHRSDIFPQDINWEATQSLANAQGLSAVVLDGIEEWRKQDSAISFPEKRFLTQWIGEVLQGYEYRYELYRRALAEMAGFYNSHGYKLWC